MQRVQIAQLTHAGLAGGEPEIHHGEGVAAEQLVTADIVAVQILAGEGGELGGIAVGGGSAGDDAVRGDILRGNARAVGGDIQQAGEFLLQRSHLVLQVLDLRGARRQQRQLLLVELILGGLNGLEQEIAVVVAGFHHGHALVRGQEDLLPQLGIVRQDLGLLRHQLVVEGLGLLHGLGLAVVVVLIHRGLFAAGSHAAHQQEGQQQGQDLFHVHFDSSVFTSVVVCSFLLFCLPLPKP